MDRDSRNATTLKRPRRPRRQIRNAIGLCIAGRHRNATRRRYSGRDGRNRLHSVEVKSDDESDDSDDEDEDDTEALLAELEQIKKERAEEKLRKERLEQEEELKVKEAELLRGNPLLNNATSFNVKRRYEPELIKKIVTDTSAKLPPIPLPMKHLVGLDAPFEMVKPLLDIESRDAIRMLEIYGGGGIGKTTFALDIYNKIRHQFEAASFLANVREKSGNSAKGLEDLQKTLLSEMGEETQTMMGSILTGGFDIKRRLGQKKVLLVLDDVDSIKQLEALAGAGDWFGSSSRIIVTTRDTALVDKHVMDGVIIQKYEMKELNDSDSLELFSWHAFYMSKPAEDFEDFAVLALSYAKGIPLALKVIGSNLKGGSLKDWEVEIEKYKNIPNAEIQEVLEISYISLFELDQKTFLDIACFFKGERWEYVERILKASDFFPNIRPFVMKSLLNVDENGCLDMHDLIQDMGREVVRKVSPLNLGDRSRLWSYKDVLQVLKENLGSTTIEGIVLDPPNHEDGFHWVDTAFEKMENLRILIIRNTTFSKAPEYLPNSLRLLDWKGYPSKSFPPGFYP